MNYHFKYIVNSVKSFNYPNLKILEIDANIKDYIKTFNNLHKKASSKSKIILISINSLWKPIIYLAKKLKLTSLKASGGWISLNQLENISSITNFKVIDKGYRLIIPKYIPFLSDFINNIFYKIPLLKRLGLIQYIILSPSIKGGKQNLSCSIIIPCFNEEGNIEECIKKCPKFGKFTEVIIVNDGSTDRTEQRTRNLMKQFSFVKLISYKSNKGKGYAVEKGMSAARGDVLIIWDADRTVPEEDLNLFYQVLATGQARFANGTRLVYPMEDQAMKWLNLFGNKIFSVIFSWILSSPISDTLCGTKALLRKDYNKISMGSEPWGDFDLLFGAAKLKLKIIEIPVHYKKRVAGESKMKIFKHGFLLAKMAFIGALRLKLIHD